MQPSSRRVTSDLNSRIAAELRALVPEEWGAQSELARRAGLPRQALTKMFQGRALTIENVDAFLRAAGVEWGEFMRRVG